MKYLDLLAQSQHKEHIWRLTALITAAAMCLMSIALVILSIHTIKAVDAMKFVMVPSAQNISTVRQGELPNYLISRAFNDLIKLTNSWTYQTIDVQFETIYKDYYSHELATRVKANVLSQKLIETAKNKKLVSLWQSNHTESKFAWCDKAKGPEGSRGMACGIVAGEITMYADTIIPISSKKIGYLIFALNIASNPQNPEKNLFSLEVIRVKRGIVEILQKELDETIRTGTMPPQGEIYEAY